MSVKNNNRQFTEMMLDNLALKE